MSQPAAPLPFDARPLTEQVDRAQVRAYVRQLRASGRLPRRSVTGIVVAVFATVVVLFVFSNVLTVIFGSFGSFGSIAGSGRPAGILAVIPGIILIALLVGGGILAWSVATGRVGGTRVYRLGRFAQANGMTWYPEVATPPLPGMIFGLGHSRRAIDILRGERPRLVEFGNYSYKTGSGKNESTHRWGYVAVKLGTPLPHIVLDAVGNNSFLGSNLPAAFDRSQRLSLEGDFDRHFALFCPEGYERDALYLFTPDIMARFVDTAAALDVEIVDDWMFLYTQRQVSTLDPATWAWLFSVVAALLGKLDQWERWRDDRLDAAHAPTGPGAPGAPSLPFAAPSASLRPPIGVAPEGRRLRRRVPWAAIVILAAMLLFFVLTQTGILAGLFGAILR
ncbi:hypothetical protein [Microbacterium flavum]|uniref:DUF3137 domain-containing protein n=1 Tax=Microbacterium flavum TaxID=415216 RepID=A0ABS5XT64_9MICO|nr:hypothetical protein [Microbacterium flavum]MBT8797712.1 hypothetical protein [Microbacterium flavum]